MKLLLLTLMLGVTLCVEGKPWNSEELDGLDDTDMNKLKEFLSGMEAKKK